MGKIYPASEISDLYVSKTTSGVVLVGSNTQLVKSKQLPIENAIKQAKISCIQCQSCTQMCPRYLTGHSLEPHKIMRAMAYSEDINETLKSPCVKEALSCSECGLCEVYACPMGLSPRKVNQMLKTQYRNNGIRYEKLYDNYEEREMRSFRRVNSKRLAMRLGVEDYYDYQIDSLEILSPDTVTISVAWHIGAPGNIIVKEGDSVQKGDVIAQIPDNALGAVTHSSITGVVKSITNNMVTITKQV